MAEKVLFGGFPLGDGVDDVGDEIGEDSVSEVLAVDGDGNFYWVYDVIVIREEPDFYIVADESGTQHVVPKNDKYRNRLH